MLRVFRSKFAWMLFASQFRSNSRLPVCFLEAHQLTPPRLISEHRPRCLGPAATLAHMVERRRFGLDPGLFGTGEEDLQV